MLALPDLADDFEGGFLATKLETYQLRIDPWKTFMNRPASHKSDQFDCPCSVRSEEARAVVAYGPSGRSSSLIIVVVCTLVAVLGCTDESASRRKPNSSETTTARQTKVVAQGQILPAGGLIRLAATPGDIIDEIRVSVGDKVEADQPLVIMRSLKLHEARVEALQSRLQDAELQQSGAVQQSKLQVTTAEARVQQADAQQKSLERQADLLALAKEQVVASEKALERIESVAKDPLTSSFVGEMQIDQQRLAVGEAKLKYEQQVESFEQAKEAAQLGKLSAAQQLEAAQLALQIATQSLAVKSIESELKALKLQIDSATIKAPQAAVVVAVNARAGEAAAQFPIVELADVTRTICEAEVVEVDAGRIKVDQSVTISSPALPKPLHGRVNRISRLVGRPQLAIADPLAKADYRALNAIIEIDSSDIAIASEWLQLQVQVEIAIEEPKTESPGSDARATVPKS